MDTLLVDFNNPNSNTIKRIGGTQVISIPVKPSTGWLARDKNYEVSIRSLSLNIDIPKDIVLKDKSKFALFTVQFEGDIQNQLGDRIAPFTEEQYHQVLTDLVFTRVGKEIKSLNFRYTLYLDLSQISDYTGNKDQEVVKIDFLPDLNINSSFENSGEPLEIALDFRREQPKARSVVKIDSYIKEEGYYYQKNPNLKIGELVVECKAEKECSQNLNVDVDLQLFSDKDGNSYSSALFFEDSEEVKEKGGSNIINLPTNNGIRVESLSKGKKATIGIYLNLNMLPVNTIDFILYNIKTKTSNAIASRTTNLKVQEGKDSFRIFPLEVHKRLKSNFDYAKDFSEPASYSLENQSKVGVLKIEAVNASRITYPLDFTINLEFDKKNKSYEDLLVIGNIDNLEISEKILLSLKNKTDHKIVFSDFPKDGSIEIPILFNMEELEINTNNEVTIDSIVKMESCGIIQEVENINFNISPVRLLDEFEMEIELHEDFKFGYEHKYTDKPARLGTLILGRNLTNYNLPLDFDISMDLIELPELNVIIHGFKEEFSQKGITIVPNSISEFSFSGLKPGKKVRLPILINLQKLPKEEFDVQTFKALVKLDCLETSISKTSPTINIDPEKISSELVIEYLEGTDFKRIALNSKNKKSAIRLAESANWSFDPDQRTSESECFLLQFSNNAKKGKGAVYVRNIKAEFGEIISKKKEEKSSEALFISTETSVLKLANPSNNYNFFKYRIENDRFNDSIESNSLEELSNESFNLKDGSTPEVIEFVFRHSDISKMVGYNANLVCKLSFDYLELDEDVGVMDDEAFAKGKMRYNLQISFSIKKDEGDYWLALDLGTSATVAAFDNERTNPDIINLQKQLENYLANSYDVTEIAESNTKFLSSVIKLRDKGYIDPLSGNPNELPYNKDIIQLSPKKNEIMNALHLMIPYLKSLIGTHYINDFNPDLAELLYYDNEEKLTKNDIDRGQINGEIEYKKIEVSTLLKNTYLSIFRDFIIKSDKILNKESLFNKMVISVPNTFTPRHTDLIRKILIQNFNDGSLLKEPIQEDNLIFISESDAVAAYYVIHSDLYPLENKASFKKKNKEYLLVYDMGAGTLDLTYLKIESDDINNKKNIEIIGRLGKSTAGNYFDYVIAKAVFDLYGKEGGAFLIDPFSENFDQRNQRLLYKEFIRNEVKPLLGRLEISDIHGYEVPTETHNNSTLNKVEDEDEIIDFESEIETQPAINEIDEEKNEFQLLEDDEEEAQTVIGVEDERFIIQRTGGEIDFLRPNKTLVIDLRRLVKDEEIQKLLKENTDILFDNFFKLFSDREESIKGKIPIDTVLLSGRNSQMICLQEAIQNSIQSRIIDPEFNMIRADEIAVEEGELANKDSILKSVVVKGAMQYVTNMIRQKDSKFTMLNRNLKAEYGFLLRDKTKITNAWKYIRMLKPGDPPFEGTKVVKKDGLTIHSYLVRKDIDITDIEQIAFVQSFSADTEKDYNSNRREYISEMFKVNINLVRRGNATTVDAEVKITTEDRMLVKIGKKKETYDEPLKVDLTKSDSFIKSMWPYFNKG